MGMRESDHESVRILIARTPVPRIPDLLRAHLDHSVRYVGAYEYMSMSTGTDKRINEVCVILLLCLAA